MEKLYKKALKAYLEMLEIHIDTKTTDVVFHETTSDFYEKLFEIAHLIWEKHVDLGWNLREDSLVEKKKRANEIIKGLRKDIEEYKENHKISLWTEDLLGSIANDLENIEWTSKGFTK